MLTLFTLLILGLGIAYFAIQNTQGVTLTLANYSLTNIPLYTIAIASMLLGIVLSWILSLPDAVGSFFTIRTKENAINQAHKSIDDLREEMRQLELENARLKGDNGVIKEEQAHEYDREHERDRQEEYRPSLLHRLKHSFR